MTVFRSTGLVQGCYWKQVKEELKALGLNLEAIDGILEAIRLESLESLEGLLGSGNEAVVELKELFALAEAAGCHSYLEFDPGTVRGLAYYTGIILPPLTQLSAADKLSSCFARSSELMPRKCLAGDFESVVC